jgi:tRNA nucleotidyltransferase/poly(A) polymerase
MRKVGIGVAFLLGLAIGLCSLFFRRNLSENFLAFRLYEILSLFLPIGVGTGIAAYYAGKLSHHTRKLDSVVDSFDELGKQYDCMFELVDKFMQSPTSGKTKEITVQFKSLWSKVGTLERRSAKLGIDKDLMESIKRTHQELDRIVTGVSFGENIRKDVYSQEMKDKAKLLMQNIGDFIFEARLKTLD